MSWPCAGRSCCALFTHLHKLDTPRNDSACRRRGSTCRVFTSGTWILQVRGSSGGHILAVGARQQRRSLVHAVGGHVGKRDKWRAEAEERLLAAPSLHSARRSSQRLGAGAELLQSSSPGDGSLEEEELHGAPRPSDAGPRAWAEPLSCGCGAKHTHTHTDRTQWWNLIWKDKKRCSRCEFTWSCNTRTYRAARI